MNVKNPVQPMNPAFSVSSPQRTFDSQLRGLPSQDSESVASEPGVRVEIDDHHVVFVVSGCTHDIYTPEYFAFVGVTPEKFVFTPPTAQQLGALSPTAHNDGRASLVRELPLSSPESPEATRAARLQASLADPFLSAGWMGAIAALWNGI